ncbi:olefin beta-lactone synthetase-like [Halichondria panicea]|uniref:olefin beta-lactone synthetase-like n=1 Tax=Halichondria panicea TaxID=6063 RepID=UPI00312B47D5
MEATSNFSFHILKSLRQYPNKVLLAVNSDDCCTGVQLHEKITATITLLKWRGVSPNDRVLMTVPVSVDFYAIAIAVFAIGGSVIIIDPSMGLERCDHCIAVAKSSVWIWKKGSKFKYIKYLLPSLSLIPTHLEVGDLTLPTTSHELFDPSEVIPVDHALVTFTTGSTGMPKLLLRKHSFVLKQFQAISISYETVIKSEIGLEEKDAVFITNLPVFPLHFLNVGSTCLIYPNILKFSPSDVLKQAKKFNATAITGSPAFVEKIANYAIKQNISLPVQYTAVGGAPIYKGVFRKIASVTPGRKAAVIYGSTEAEPVSVVFAQEKMALEGEDSVGHCVGQPVFKGSVKIIKILDGPPTDPVNIARDYELPPGEIGEIVVSGWHVNTYQVDAARLLTDDDGLVWLRIEDAGYMDKDGRIWLVGRVKWRVERNGETFWSVPVEQKILDRCSLITFASYLSHNGEAWLFLEAPTGLPDREKAGVESLLSREGIPVDHLSIRKSLPRDRRHQSKPNTAALFNKSNPNSFSKIIKLFLRANTMLAVVFIFFQMMLIAFVSLYILGNL